MPRVDQSPGAKNRGPYQVQREGSCNQAVYRPSKRNAQVTLPAHDIKGRLAKGGPKEEGRGVHEEDSSGAESKHGPFGSESP